MTGKKGDKGMVMMRHVCPSFSGKKEEYEDWRIKVEDWLLLSEGEVKYPGVEIRLGLEGKALEVGKEMERDVLKGPDGANELMEKLDKRYRKDKMMENYIKVRNYLKVERKEKEKIEDYLQKYERLAEECKKAATGSMLTGEIKGCHLLEQANLNEQQKQMVLSACGKDKLEYEMVAKVMKRIFEGIGEEEGKEEWWERGRMGVGNQSNRTEKRDQENWKKKTIGREGRVTKCAICGSEYHWARECPKNYKNSKDQRGKQREGETKGKEVKEGRGEEKVYMGGIGEEEDWTEVEAILDTGCSSTVCGDR
jgi:hypothetical protein